MKNPGVGVRVRGYKNGFIFAETKLSIKTMKLREINKSKRA